MEEDRKWKKPRGFLEGLRVQGRMGDRSCGGTSAGQPLCTSSGPAQDSRPIIDPRDRPIIIEVGINIEAKSNRRTMSRESGTRPIIKDFRLPNHLLAARPFGMTNWLPLTRSVPNNAMPALSSNCIPETICQSPSCNERLRFRAGLLN